MRLIDLSTPAADARAEILAGLAAPAPFIAPKYFYDRLGARLFEAICELPEYTLTRDEALLFARHKARIAAAIGPGCTLVDLGAGDCAKAEALFEALRPAQYVAVDIGRDTLEASLAGLARRHPALEVIGIAQDFSRALRLPPPVRPGPRLIFFPGSSIGNFEPEAAAGLLARLRDAAEGGWLLLGADLVKTAREHEAAYDDALGVTAAFNRNVLNHVNRIAGTDFDLTKWEHRARFDGERACVEMHLAARGEQPVRWNGGARRFAAGETIHTEVSCKYSVAALTAMLAAAGFREVQIDVDEPPRFALALARA